MRLNGRIVAAAIASVLVAGGATGGYLLTAGSARADNANGCTATPASGGICSIADVALPANQDVYLQFEPSLPKGVTAHASVAVSGTCGGQAIQETVTGLPPNIVYISQSLVSSCTLSAKVTATFSAATANTLVTVLLNYTTPGAPAPSPSPSSGGGGHTGGGAAIKGPSGKCLDDAKNSASLRAKVDIWSCNGSNAQKWTYTRGEVTHNGLCLNAKSNGQVILWSCNGQANEIWIFNTLNHEVLLRAHNFSQCLTDPKGSTRNGTQLVVSACKNSASQHWSLPGH
ncbi:MAG TPA: RICIN domain-containing protein [Streptosporangiaceae bacterium]|nr:RICIN domain-containing protein [Streptosporangiaceae bacterium]